MRQEDWLKFRRNGDLYEKDDFRTTVIKKSLSFIVPLSYFLVPLDKYRKHTHEFVSVTGTLIATVTAAASMKFT